MAEEQPAFRPETATQGQPSSRWRLVPWFALAVVISSAATAAIVWQVAPTSGPEKGASAAPIAPPSTDMSEQRRIMVEHSVFVPQACGIVPEQGFSDVPGAQVEALDGEGRYLGFGEVPGRGEPVTGGCLFSMEFEIAQAEDGIYRVGNERRGHIGFDEADVLADTLVVAASLED